MRTVKKLGLSFLFLHKYIWRFFFWGQYSQAHNSDSKNMLLNNRKKYHQRKPACAEIKQENWTYYDLFVRRSSDTETSSKLTCCLGLVATRANKGMSSSICNCAQFICWYQYRPDMGTSPRCFRWGRARRAADFEEEVGSQLPEEGQLESPPMARVGRRAATVQ